MFLKHRNIIAVILLVISSFLLCFVAYTERNNSYESATDVTTYDTVLFEKETLFGGNKTYETYGIGEELSEIDTGSVHTDDEKAGKMSVLLRAVLLFSAALLSLTAIFVLRQKTPLIGPDGVLLCFALILSLYYRTLAQTPYGDILRMYSAFFIIFAVQLLLREFWGWLLFRADLSWCLTYRISRKINVPQISLLLYVVWLIGSYVLAVFLLKDVRRISFPHTFDYYLIPIVCIIGFAMFDICCLWRYGSDLHHFQKQLDNFKNDTPIRAKDGAFLQTEIQLSNIQKQHREAVEAAVSSERFKVELIANVSHDLRTPLTSILGYGELLNDEPLTERGKEQLALLNRKAGYMSDLVGALFELTKVSSGVVESRKDEIDLVCLLEQTVGMYNDQLSYRGLEIRRDYFSEKVTVVTDGTLMHQVFGNLLENAIKYALSGTRIFLDVKEEEDCYKIRVVNTSSYEMDFKADEILQRFARGDKARSTQGSGLGLAIAQTYTESCGGKFNVFVDGDQFSAIVKLPKIERKM